MKRVLALVLAVLPIAAAAEPGFHERLYERYCGKLRESPEAYVQFVKRLKPIHGYDYADFAPVHKGDPVRADCKVSSQQVAAVHEAVRKAGR